MTGKDAGATVYIAGAMLVRLEDVDDPKEQGHESISTPDRHAMPSKKQGAIQPSMKNYYFSTLCILPLAVIFVSGCATSNKNASLETESFEPVAPVAAVEAQDLTQVEGDAPRSVTDLLREADKAFQAANTAQESGDEEAALRQYVLMLELLTEADLDPKIFYSLREEFGAILNGSTQHANLYQSRPYSPLDDGAVTPPTTHASPGDLSAFEIPFPLPEPVLEEIDKIQNSYPKNFQIFLDRSHKYLPHIRQRLRENGMPEELAYLALVESGFQPKIVSRAGAGGMWQFMRPAAQRFNLRVDSHVDERYDWISSTDAAIEYLKVLHSHFNGSWPLALSAYNMGEGGLQRAIEANGGETDLWTLIETPPASNRIRLETKEYFARFVASVIVAHSPERYGFQVNAAPAEELVKVPVNGAFSLSRLDQHMGYSEGTLARLNPALLNETTPPSGNYHVLVPKLDTERFASALTSAEPVTVQYAGGNYKVKRGETVSQIATRHGVSATELMRVNGIRSARGLRAGETLKLPDGASEAKGGSDVVDAAPVEEIEVAKAAEEKSASSRKAGSVGKGSKATYTVKSGDTLFDIAKAHKVSVADLQSWNNKGRRERLKVGETLQVGDTVVPEVEPAIEETAETIVASAEGNGEFHEVQPGEYPAKIARDYDVPLRDFLAWNNLGSKSTIKVGDKLVVAAGTPEQPREDVKEAPKAKEAPKEEEIKLASAEPVSKATKEKAADKEKPVGTNAGTPGAKATHTVKKGESASVIAEKYGVKTSDFLAWNNLTSKSVLQAGKTYKVYAPGDSKPPAKRAAAVTPDETIHKVTSGQNPSTIAKRYGVKISDLFKWNEWPKNHVLQVGDKVVIRKG
jgi:membrane-bound lytic murein transglycosylase D